jgi:hypothetical protein
MEKLKFSIDHMFQYLQILQDDAATARERGQQKKLDAVLLRMDSIKVMLDTALFNTFEEQAPALKINMDMFDMKALAKVLPGVNLKALPQTIEIDFRDSDSEEVQVLSESDLVNKLNELLSSSFVSKIQPAVDLYLKETGKEIMPADAWIQVKDLLKEHRLIPRWDLFIAGTLEKDGPLAAYAQIKKNLPHWGDGEIARILEDAVKRTCVHPKTALSQARELQEIISNPFPRAKIKAWASAPNAIEVISKYVRPGAGQSVAASEASMIIAMMDPHKRDKIESGVGRKPYVEKGY